jgi:hypothetical protein
MMFGKIVGTVQFAGGPVKIELFLGYPVFEPMVPHVKGLWSFEANLGVKNAMSCGIVGFEWCAIGRLCVPHFFKGGTDRDGILRIEKEGTNFGFGSWCGNAAERFAKGMNGTVCLGSRRRTGGRGKSSEEKMAGSTAASVWEDKIG